MHKLLWRPTVGRNVARRRAVAAVAAVLLCVASTLARAVPPVVPGYHRLKDEAKADAISQGEILLGELNCTACHAAPEQKRVLVKGAPDLKDAGARLTPQYIRAYLADPHGVKPGATMPDVFHASAPQAKQGAVEFLTHYLVSLGGGPIKPAKEDGNTILVDQGRTLYHTVGCVACHAPEKAVPPAVPEKGASAAHAAVPSVPLDGLAMKTTADQLTNFLMDPLKVRPGSRMPSAGLSRGEAAAIAVYLLREQIDNPQSKNATPPRGRGVKYTYYTKANSADVTRLDPLKPAAEGRAEAFSIEAIKDRAKSDYAVKFTGAISIPRDGKYTFWTKSDDGSRLYIDGNQVIDNEGIHAPAEKSGVVDLKAGDHPITVTFFQGGGGDELTVSWAGPQIKRQPVPPDVLFSVGGQAMVPLQSEDFKVDTEKAQMGRQMFGLLGCANCHTTTGVPPGRPAKALAALNLESDEGCLGEHVKKGLPKYDASPDQRQAIKAALKDVARLNTPLTAKEQVTHTMAAMNCYACHRRDNVGGPTAERAALFVMRAEFDMGDEGRIPPQLDSVGYKLRPEAMEQIIFESKLHVRPALAARMPRFNKERMTGFVEAAAQADATASPPADPQFSEQSAKDGHRLIGTKGLGCVNCHGVLGQKSLGMPAPDLTSAHERLRYGWYAKLMHDPVSMNPGTRMPAFWANDQIAFKDIAGGTPDGQIAATWNYLSLGTSMALPAGLAPAAGSELMPTDEPIVHRTFMADVGARAILVGYPERLNVAFDANLVRLAEAWRGRFFDTKGMWNDRGGQALGPLGTDLLKLPPGPAFAILANPSDAWPAAKGGPPGGARDLGGKYRGFVLDKDRRPVFHYTLPAGAAGDVEVHEQPLPVLKPGGALLVRRFTLSSKGDAKGLTFVAAAGKKIEAKSPGVWTVDDTQTVRLTGGKGAEKLDAVVRDAGGGAAGKLLVVPVSANASFDVEMSW